MTAYNTNLASEFHVGSMLHRLGVDAALTPGNKKAVDIVVIHGDATTLAVEVKGLEKWYDGPADHIRELRKPNPFPFRPGLTDVRISMDFLFGKQIERTWPGSNRMVNTTEDPFRPDHIFARRTRR